MHRLGLRARTRRSRRDDEAAVFEQTLIQKAS
jgi:hypothetical protein